ncbi:PAS domain S-box protein, partial [Rhodoferax sp. 4810]|nr:PAS domain S-box protein [Rhodoferax jenense]
AIMAADRKGEIILMNKAAENLFGYSVHDANLVNIADFYPPGTAREIMKKLRDKNIGEAGKLPSTQVNIITKNGEQIPVEMTAAIIYEDGHESATAAIFNDLREKRAVQKRLEETESQLFQSEKLASLGRLAAGVAHEINNPLTSILLYGNLMREKLETNHPLSSNLSYILEDAERCKDIVKNLLAYSRQTRPAKNIFYLNNLISESLRLIRDQKLFMNVKIIKELDECQILVNADKNQLCQVLINLIINAIDAMDGNGTLILKTYRDSAAGKAYIEVSDTGSGIPQENLAKVFDPFFTTKDVGKGTGLGLSMAYGILEENHGKISIKQTGPGGTTILLELPEETVSNGFQFMSIG